MSGLIHVAPRKGVKITLLILSCGTNANWHIVKILRAKFMECFRIVGVDANPEQLVAASLMLDAFYRVPPSDSGMVEECVESVIRKERPQFILPSFDFDQQIFSSSNEMLNRYGVKTLAAPVSTLKIYENKQAIIEACRKVSVPVPRCFQIDEIDDALEYFIKPIRGVGSKGARKVHGGEARCLLASGDYLAQEVCWGPEVTLECFLYGGRISSVCRERIVAKAGVCVKARVYKNKELENIALQFSKAYKLPMIFNLQFMHDSRGRYVVTDINLRTAGGMSISYAAGWDAVSAFAKVLLGRSNEDVFRTLPDFLPEQYVVRVYEDVVTETRSQTVAFDLDGTLLDSRARHRAVLDDILRAEGKHIDTADLIEFKSFDRNNVEYLTSKGVVESEARAIQEKWISKIEASEYLAKDQLYPEVESFMEQFVGCRRVLVTARANYAGLMQQLADLGIGDWFDAIYVVKPGKTTWEEKAEVLAAQSAVVYYGDTLSDRLAAQKACCEFKFHENGFHNRNTVLGCGRQ